LNNSHNRSHSNELKKGKLTISMRGEGRSEWEKRRKGKRKNQKRGFVEGKKDQKRGGGGNPRGMVKGVLRKNGRGTEQNQNQKRKTKGTRTMHKEAARAGT